MTKVLKQTSVNKLKLNFEYVVKFSLMLLAFRLNFHCLVWRHHAFKSTSGSQRLRKQSWELGYFPGLINIFLDMTFNDIQMDDRTFEKV